MTESLLSLEKAAEFEGFSYEALKKRCARKFIVLVNDPRDSRRKLFPARMNRRVDG